MKVIAEQPEFGAIVSDIDILHLSTEEKQQLKDCLHKYKVLSIDVPDLNDEERNNIADIFGSIPINPLSRSYPDVERNNIFLFGGNWHNDMGTQVPRSAYTILFSKQIPSEGGDTLFLDNVNIYETLPSILKDYLKDKVADFSDGRPYVSLEEAIYSRGKKSFGANRFYDKEYSSFDVERVKKMFGNKFSIQEFKRQNKYVDSVQPLVVTHPHTSKTVLNLNSSWTHSIHGLSEQESERILQLLFKHQESSPVYRLKWKPNMFTIWDNRLVLHKATPSISNEPRIMYRLTRDDPIERN